MVAVIQLSINTVAPHVLVLVAPIGLLHQCNHSNGTNTVALTSQLSHQGGYFTKAINPLSGRFFGGMDCMIHVDILLLLLLHQGGHSTYVIS